MPTIHQTIRNRRSIFPKEFTANSVTKESLLTLLENARWAPTHKFTQPWRFRVVRGAAKIRLGQALVGAYQRATPKEQHNEAKLQSIPNKCDLSAAVILVSMQRDPEQRIPEWEEIAAVAAAVQNMWLTAATLGLGMYWSSPKYAQDIGEFCQFSPDERCLGLLYIGAADPTERSSKREPVESFTQWFDE